MMIKNSDFTLKNQNNLRSGKLSSLVTFKVNEQLFALPITIIKDIFQTNNITPVQLAPKGIFGLLNIRGHIYTVISLRECLELPALDSLEDQMFYSIERDDEKYCLMVDTVGEVLMPERERFEELPCTLEKPYKTLASEIYKSDSEILILLDVEKIFTHKKLLSEEAV